MIRCALFDLDGTLYDFAAASAAALDAVSLFVEQTLGIPAAEARDEYRRLLHEQQADSQNSPGGHSRLIRYQRLLEERGLPLRFARPVTETYWNAFVDSVKVFPDAAPALDRLRALGLRIGLGTNMTAYWQFRKLERLGLLDRFDFIVSSEEVGSEKPSPRFFAMCVRKARCPVSECLFVGDDLQLDVFGALDAGLQAAWLQPDAAQRAEHPDVRSIASLIELPSLVDK